jgi:hypothetical protein
VKKKETGIRAKMRNFNWEKQQTRGFAPPVVGAKSNLTIRNAQRNLKQKIRNKSLN